MGGNTDSMRGRTFDLETADATRRMVRSAVLIGLVTILGTCAIAYSGYAASRQTMLRQYAGENLTLAHEITDHITLNIQEGPISKEAHSDVVEWITRLWKEKFYTATRNRELAVIDPTGNVVSHTGSEIWNGQNVRDVALYGKDRGGRSTLGEHLLRRQDFRGQTGPVMGEERIVGGAFIRPLDIFVAVHIPTSIATKQLRSAALPWGLGISAIASLLVPLSLALLYRSYRMAQDSALNAMTSFRRSEARYRDLYHNTPVMMHSIDDQGRLIKVNEYWLKSLGYERDEALGRSLTEFFTEESARFAAEVGLPEFFATGVCHDVPYRMVAKDGRIVEVLLSATAERDENGKLIRSQARLVDVTAQKLAEVEREQMIHKLEQKNVELERFTYTVSHDLKSPIITIKGFLGYMNKDLEEARYDRVQFDLARVCEAADKMKDLLEDLLELSRIGRIVNPPEDVSLEDLTREAVELVAGSIAERGVNVEISPDLPWVRCDRARMLQVLQNLIENAIKFMGEESDPRIVVGFRGGDEDAICFVRDNGIGIDEKNREKVFELFTKLDSKMEGTGIGLALAARIIEVHGGRIWAESEGTGAGSTFCFTLPIANLPEESGILKLDELKESLTESP